MRQSKRGWRLGLVAALLTAALALGLLSRLAMPPAAAEPIGPGQSADDLMQEFETLCSAKGGDLDVWQTGDGSIHMSCILPTYTAYCSFLFDGDEFYDIECWDEGLGTTGSGQTIGGGSGNGSVLILPTPRLAGLAGNGSEPVNAPPDLGSTPTPTSGPAGSVNKPVISGVNAPPNVGPAPTPTQPATGRSDPILGIFQPTPTPTRPGGSVLGGIVATIGPAKLPPEPTQPPAGNRSGIALILRECPPALPKLPQQFADCSVNQSVNNQVTFLVGGPGVQEVTVHGGGLNLNGLPAGKYLIRMTIPTGYDNPVGFCSFAPSEDQAPVPSQKVPIGGGSYTFELGQDQTIYCNWYITLDLSRAPAKMAAATPVAAGSPVMGSQPPSTGNPTQSGSGTQNASGSTSNPPNGQPTPTVGPATPTIG